VASTRRLFLLFAAVSLGHVLLISSQVQARSGLPVIQDLAFGTFAGVHRATSGVTDWVRGGWRHYVALGGVSRENDALRARILELEGRLQQERALATKTQALEAALGLRATTADPLLAARVTAGSAAPGVLSVTIDRGSSDGVAEDMAVIGAQGVVGRVIGPVAPRASLVQLLAGRNAAAAVVFERSGAGALAVGGRPDGLLRGQYVPILADIQAGERVTTSGKDRVFPAGLLVGTVDQVVRVTASEREVLIRPATDFSSIDLVLVVLSRPSAAGGGS
jgi:rod shape-determining protein MreC